ncbi:PleD family two-component system response regulator [Elusimicrobiota bacterium]
MGKKIVLIEDSQTVVSMLTAILQAKGYKVFAGEDGKKAMDLVRKVSPDLIILDINLPGSMDGFAICQFLKANKKYNRIPIIMFTGQGTVGEVNKAFKMGANDYLVKPQTQGDFYRLIDKVKKWAP